MSPNWLILENGRKKMDVAQSLGEHTPGLVWAEASACNRGVVLVPPINSCSFCSPLHCCQSQRATFSRLPLSMTSVEMGGISQWEAQPDNRESREEWSSQTFLPLFACGGVPIEAPFPLSLLLHVHKQGPHCFSQLLWLSVEACSSFSLLKMTR